MSSDSNQKLSRVGSGHVRVLVWKRILDVALILLLLPVVLPVAALISLLIAVVSSGPILFKQERVGLQGRLFVCLKFRTMHMGAAATAHQGHLDHLIESDAPMVKLDARGDSRIIPFGSWLRSSGLDELPQLINVLRGDMSLVGPRPCLPYESPKYRPWQRERFDTLPGLTGLWQVNGKNRTTFNEMVALDIEYVRRKCLWLDLRIMLRTPPVLLRQVRDYYRRRKASRNPVVSGVPAERSNS